MKCANCQMVNQVPGTSCSHCGKLVPHPEPITSEAPPDDANVPEGEGEGEGEAETNGGADDTNQGDAGTDTPDAGTDTPDAGTDTPDAGTDTPDAGTDTPDAGTEGGDDETVTPEGGHVDNVGDESEKATVVP